ncbi:MAG: YraN family protein [Victivallales bacterium]|nr:YraN family protein [Victivallales bacterium]
MLRGITLCELAKNKLHRWRREAALWLRPARLVFLRRRSARLGRSGEKTACQYLLNAGYELLCRNYQAPHGVGELDLVMRDAAGVLCFIEVKTRRERPDQTVHPAWAVHDAKQLRLRKAATAYLRALAVPNLPTRFDVIEIWASRNGQLRQLRHWPDAFPAYFPARIHRHPENFVFP